MVVCVGAISYFLYLYSYNQARDAMSLMIPEFILSAYAQPNNDTDKELARIVKEWVESSRKF